MIRTLLAFSILALCIGCTENYELKENGGKLYRLNKKTGTIDVVEGNTITRLPEGSPNDPLGLFTPKEKAKRQNKSHVLKDSTQLRHEFDSLWNKHSIPGTGIIKDGYRFLGGNPSDSSQWVSINDILDTMKWKPGEMKMVGKYQVKKNFPWDTITPDYTFDSKSKLFVKVR
jgi:hypothetical protein